MLERAATTLSPGESAAAPGERTRPVLFAAGRDDPRARRPVDAVRAIAYLALLLTAAVLSVVGRELDARISAALVEFPGFLHALMLAAVWAAAVWAAALLVILLIRHRALLVMEALLAAGLALAGAFGVASIVGGSAGDVFSRLADTSGLAVFLTRAGVPTALALAIALSYRFIAFYMPPIWSYLSLKWLTARRYL